MSYVGTNGGNKTLAQALPDWKWEFVPQVGLHTTEFPAGHTLLGLWGFVNTRDTHGSYHAGSDAHGASGQYCPWSWGAWGAPSINRWAGHLAANCRSAEWNQIPKAWRDNLINGLALQAHRYSRWCVSIGKGPVPARRITREQALRRVYGFVYHGSLQADRTDPGTEFPWEQFLAEFIRLERGALAPAVTAPEKEKTLSLTNENIKNIASAAAKASADAVLNDRRHDLNGNGNSQSFKIANTNDQVNFMRRELAAQGAVLNAIVENIDKTNAGFKAHVTKEVDRAVSQISEAVEEK